MEKIYLQKSLDDLQLLIKRIKVSKRIIISLFPIVLFFCLIVVGITTMSLEKYLSDWTIRLLGLLIDIGIFWLICSPLFLVVSFITGKYEVSLYAWLEKIKTDLHLLYKESWNYDSLNTILAKINDINILYGKILKHSSILKIFYPKNTFISYRNFLNSVAIFLKIVLHDSNEDLQKVVKEVSKSLEWAKSEVAQNIIGTTLLDETSKLQQLRLEKQIEEFEKLEKILIKI